jgi:outer membrane lipoprotein SlyB
MFGKWLLGLLGPLALAAALGACANTGVQPGIVSTSSSSTATASTYGNAVPGDPGRVVAINEVNLAGSGGGGSGNGPLWGGILGAGSGAAIGAATSQSVVGGVVGGILGAVGGAILGTIFENHGGPVGGGRGIEVTVQKDDGQTVRVAQRDDGDVQLGDRVQIVQGRNGVAKVVRDSSRVYDQNQGGPPQNYNPPPQDYRQSRYYPPPQGYGQSGSYPPPPPPGHGPTSRDYSPYGYGQSGNYPSGNYPSGNYPSGNYPAQSQDYRQSQYSPQPQDDPRNGNLN